MPAKSERVVLNSTVALAAASVATFLAWVSHDWLGYSWPAIREAALIAASIVPLGYISVRRPEQIIRGS
jgi:hypothetical protein